MGIVVVLDAEQENWTGEYTPDYNRWHGFYQRVPTLAARIDAICEAAVSNCTIEGPNSETLLKFLDSITGNGKQTFKVISYNLIKSGIIGGDSFAEVIYDDSDNVENLMQLPSGNMKILFKNGVIKKYIEVDGDGKWKPEQILHCSWNPSGASVHGTSVIERLNDILIAKNQIEDDCRRIYHRYIKPIHIIKIDSDDDTEIANFKAEWAKLKNIPEADIFTTKDFVEIERAAIPEFATLKPDPWRDYLMKVETLSTGVPEVRLGEGAQANSEATAKIQDKGFRDKVKWTQNWYEAILEKQLFPQIYPKGGNKINFSFLGESEEDAFNRYAQAFKIISSDESIDKGKKTKVLEKLLNNMGLLK